MEPADHPMTFTEREALFDACDRFLAEAAAARARPTAPTRRTDCPICNHRLGHQYRQWRGAVLYCPRCQWEGPPA